jgi:peptidoglycan/xylan/chitin deacetylase (PgdA/CDA1 family)
MSVRAALKACLEAGLVRSGVPALHRAARASRALVLAYHNVVPDSCTPFGDRSLHLPRGRFVRQLDRLLATHTVVPLDELLAPDRGRRRPRAAITFDDGYRGAVRIGVEELAKRGLAATLFVVPGFVGKGPFWWDALAGERGMDELLRRRALDDLRGSDAEVRGWAAVHGVEPRAVPEWALPASEGELRDAARHPGITFGSHTWTHPNLARLSATELRAELTEPLVWLRERFASVARWVSYPYGIATPAVEAATRDAGYTGGLVLGGGWFPPGRVNRWAVPRENIPSGLSENGFVIRTSGL